MTLRAKASIILCLLITATLGITGYYYLAFLESSLRASLFKGLSGVADSSSQLIGRFLSDSLREAQAVASALPPDALEARDARQIENRLRRYSAIFSKFENGMFVLDEKGALWADYPPHPEVRGKRFDYRQYFQQTMARQHGIIGVPYRSARTGQPVLTFTALLRNRRGKTIGMLGCSVQLTSRKALEGIRLTKIGRTGYLYVYNKDRLMILHPQVDRILENDVPVGANRLFDAAIEGFEGTGETVNSRGVPMLISLKHIEGTDWIIGCQQPKSEALSPITQARGRILGTIVLAAGISVFLGALLMRGITIPLVRLQEASRLVERIAHQEGNAAAAGSAFHRRIERIPGGGELGELKNAFLNMHQKLEQTMRSLQEMAADWENTFDSVMDAIFLLDGSGRIVRLNRSAVRLIGSPQPDVSGKRLEECLPGLSGKFASNIGPAGSGCEESRFDLEMKADQGEPRTYEVSGTALRNKSGKRVGMVVTAKDITSRLAAEKETIRLEKRLIKARQMEAIGTLAGGVAHDLNNILSGILSYPELLLMQLPPGSELRAPLKTIMQSGNKAAAIVQDLLTMARRGIAAFEVLQLNDIVTEYLDSPEFEKVRYHHPGIEVETHLDEDLLPIEGSHIHLTKVIMNLVANGAEAMPDGGRLTLSTVNRHVDPPIGDKGEIKPGDYAVIKVLDEGIGIEEQEVEHIFEPFYTKKVMGRSGTGLGMAVVWGTVQDHNGTIDVRSKVGAWTKFSIYLPATRKTPKTPQGHMDYSTLSGHGERLLVVDDVPEQRQIAVSILSELGYAADAVSNGEDAIAYLKNQHVDLLILDMIMAPGMDGFETFERAVEINPAQNAIIVSGFSETERVKQTQRLGAGAYIRKPYTVKTLGLAVKNALSK